MKVYDMYADLLGVGYDDGDHDCYGLCVRYYQKNYGIALPNYARSADFFSEGLDLISPFLQDSDFKVVDVAPSRLEMGDGLLLAVPSRLCERGTINHVAVFVGNSTFIHHLWQKQSCEDYLDDVWSRRIMAVVRHPDVGPANDRMLQKAQTSLLDLLPDHVKQRHGIAVTPVLEPVQRESRTTPRKRAVRRAR